MGDVVPRTVDKDQAQTGLESGSVSWWCVTLGKGLHCLKFQFPYLPSEPKNSTSFLDLWGEYKEVMQSARHSIWHIIRIWSMMSTIIFFIFCLKPREVKQIAPSHTAPKQKSRDLILCLKGHAVITVVVEVYPRQKRPSSPWEWGLLGGDHSAWLHIASQTPISEGQSSGWVRGPAFWVMWVGLCPMGGGQAIYISGSLNFDMRKVKKFLSVKINKQGQIGWVGRRKNQPDTGPLKRLLHQSK